MLGAAAALLAGGCAAPAAIPAPVDDERPLVLATFTVLADMTRQVAGDRVRVESITDVGAEIHGYEPSPRDLVRAEGADLVVANGLGLEAWLSRLVERTGAPWVVVTRDVEPIAIAGSGAPNPHAWMSPRAGTQYVAAIADALTTLDPDGAAAFAARADAYSAQLETLHDELVRALDALPVERRVLVTCEGAFSYLARDASLSEGYLWPVNADAIGTPRQVVRTVRLVRERAVPAVFCESTVADTAQRQVVRETDDVGTRFGGTLYVDSLSRSDGPVPTYLDLLTHDVRTIVAGLTGTSDA